jgi:hypothetical protein
MHRREETCPFHWVCTPFPAAELHGLVDLVLARQTQL